MNDGTSVHKESTTLVRGWLEWLGMRSLDIGSQQGEGWYCYLIQVNLNFIYSAKSTEVLQINGIFQERSGLRICGFIPGGQ